MDGATSSYLGQVFGVAPILVIVLAALFAYISWRFVCHERECKAYRREMRGKLEQINASLHELIGAVKGARNG